MARRKSKGLGDSIEKFTEATGIKSVVDKVSEIRLSPTVLAKCQKSRKKMKLEIEQKKKDENEEKLLE